MKRLQLGLTDHERAELDRRRRLHNCGIAIGVVMVAGFLVLLWIGGPG